MQTPIIDVLNDRETKLKELEKVAELYQAQWKELERIWEKNSTAVPVVVEVLGVLTSKCMQWLAEAPANVDVK